MILSYTFPVATFYSDDYELGDYDVETYEGKIQTIQLEEEPYEAHVNARGLNFHILFGHQINGWFLCIPNWKTGCELAHPSDLAWNLNTIIELSHNSRMNYEDCTAIAYAIKELSGHINQ